MDFIRLRGIGVSPGIGMGEVSLSERIIFASRKETLFRSQIDDELNRLNNAVEQTRSDLLQLKEKIKEKVGEEHAYIFDAHLLILEDKSLLSSLKNIINSEKAKAEWALSQINDKYQKVFESINDDYLKQRKSDISDVLAKVYRNLKVEKKEKPDDSKEKIIVAHDLLPSEAALRFSHGNILAVAMDMGGQTSHTAILARSLNIPAVVGLHNITLLVKNGDFIIVDGTDGEVFINPPPALKKEFLSKKEKYFNYQKELIKTAKLTSLTLDQTRFYPMANIELPEEVNLAFSFGAEGIGLFRSEFIYLQNTSLPTEEDHFAIYSRIAREAYPSPVYIRTVDIGGDKNLPQLKIEKEPNPALGLRAIRFSLKNRDLFKIQLRAIMKASFLKNVKILIPMITELEEIEEVKILFEEAKMELEKDKINYDKYISLGVMIEVPAAAAIADQLAKEVDFLSIGTNDLIQYYLAVDRTNEHVSYLYKPFHPSVLKLIKFIIDSALNEGKDVAICGEMAADPLSAIVLLGLGLRKFSMNPIFIPKIKKALRSIDRKIVEKFVNQALDFNTAQEIEEYIIEKILIKYPNVFLISQKN